jgi:methionyl-tRNA formyltransferase
MRIIFMGTPDFAVPTLVAMNRAGHRPIAVVTGPDRKKGRGRRLQESPVKKASVDMGIELILQPESVRDPEFAESVRTLSPDLLVVVAFRILPAAVFTAATRGAFNLHGSLLPRYRGAAPIHRAVLAGDSVTGVTTFFLREKVDTGNMILQRAMPIGPNDTTGDVHDRMMHLGAAVVVETLQMIDEDRVDEQPQDDSLATPAPKVFRDEAAISWSGGAQEVHNHIRGMSPVPGAWTRVEAGLLKVYRSRVAEGRGEPGVVLSADDRLVVACGSGAVELLEVQPEGRRRLTADEYVRGAQLSVGDRVLSVS